MKNSPVAALVYIILEGSVRSTKTSTGSFSFVLWAMENFDGEEFAFCGKTIGACRRNLIRPLKQMLEAEPGFKVTDKLSVVEGPHLIIEYCGKKNIFWIFGGKDESSQDLIQGITLAGIFYDEVLLMPMSFVWQGLNRLTRSGSKAWFTMNPESPKHPAYVDLLDPAVESGKAFHLHLTLDDNPALDESTKARLKSQYPAGSVLYKRNILGLRTAAEGRVFSFFDEDLSAGYVVDKVPDSFIEFIVTLDYGISNPFVASLWGLSGGVWYILKEFNWDSVKERRQKSNPDYIEDLTRLITWNGKAVYPKKILVPPEENGFIKDLKRAGQTRPNICGVDAADNKIMPGIEDVTTLMSLGKLKIYRPCETTIYGLNNLLWDPKAQAIGKDMYIKGGSGAPDHACDKTRYGGRYAAKVLRQMGLIL